MKNQSEKLVDKRFPGPGFMPEAAIQESIVSGVLSHGHLSSL